MVDTVINILKLLQRHFVSNVRHQHRCNRKTDLVMLVQHDKNWPENNKDSIEMILRFYLEVILEISGMSLT